MVKALETLIDQCSESDKDQALKACLLSIKGAYIQDNILALMPLVIQSNGLVMACNERGLFGDYLIRHRKVAAQCLGVSHP